MKFTKTTIVGVAILGLMLCSMLSPVSAAATWPVAAGDVLEYTEKEEEKWDGPGSNGKGSSQTTFKVEIVKVDANGTIVWKFVGEKAEDENNDMGDLSAYGNEIVLDSEEWKLKSADLKNRSTAAYIDDYKKTQKTYMEDTVWGLSYKNVVIEVECTSDEKSITWKRTTTGTNKDNEAFELKYEYTEEWTEDGILVESTDSSETTWEYTGGTETYSASWSLKQGGAGIPGYSVPLFLGILAFTTFGLIWAIRRRK